MLLFEPLLSPPTPSDATRSRPLVWCSFPPSLRPRRAANEVARCDRIAMLSIDSSSSLSSSLAVFESSINASTISSACPSVVLVAPSTWPFDTSRLGVHVRRVPGS